MTAPTWGLARRARVPWLPVLCAVVPLLVFFVSSGRARISPSTAVALTAAAVLMRLAVARPRAGLVVLLVAGAAVPFYDGRYVTRGLAVTPVGALCLLLLPAALGRAQQVRIVALDWAVAGYFALRVVSLLVNYGRGPGAAAGLLLSTALPYVVGRLMVTTTALARTAALATVVVAGGLSVLAVQEHAGHGNPFFSWVTPTYQATQWARPEERLGAIRAEASFGHPIAFGLFLAVALALALGLYLSSTGRARPLLLGLSGLIVVALVATLSRGPIVVAAAAVAVLLVVGATRVDARRVLVLMALLVAVSAATPVLTTLTDLRQSSATVDSREALSAQYRFKILDVVLDPAQFSLLGQQSEPVDAQSGVTAATSSRTALKSIDSEFALVYLSSGLLALLGFVLVCWHVLRAAFLPRLQLVERAWAVGVAAVAVDALTVALLTQQGELWWLAVGIVGGIVQRHRASSQAAA